MPIVRFRVQVADRATELRIIRSIGVAICAFRPLPLVFAAVNRKIISVVLRVLSRSPVQIGRMAQGAIVGKIGGDVVWVLRTFKIRQMARHAGIGRIRKIAADMAFYTICTFMPFGQREKIVIHFIRFPIGRMEVVAF